MIDDIVSFGQHDNGENEHEYLVLDHSKDLKFLSVKVNENRKIVLTEGSQKQISDMLLESLA